MLPAEVLKKLLADQTIEAAPLAFMRGRTLKRAFIILDEAQNTTAEEMKMFLTRIGEKSKVVVTGDTSQSDLPKFIKSGLNEAIRILKGIDEMPSPHSTSQRLSVIGWWRRSYRHTRRMLALSLLS